MQPFEVSEARVEWALRTIPEKIKQLMDPEQTTLMVCAELNLYPQTKYDEDGMLQFDFTDMQLVAFAAALTALAEMGGSYFSSTPLERNRVLVQRVEYADVDVKNVPS